MTNAQHKHLKKVYKRDLSGYLQSKNIPSLSNTLSHATTPPVALSPVVTLFSVLFSTSTSPTASSFTTIPPTTTTATPLTTNPLLKYPLKYPPHSYLRYLIDMFVKTVINIPAYIMSFKIISIYIVK
jgi:hypothetical protein